MDYIEFVRDGNNMRVNLGEKSVLLKGHQDRDVYRIFAEHFETSPSLSDSDRQVIRMELERKNALGASLPIIIC